MTHNQKFLLLSVSFAVVIQTFMINWLRADLNRLTDLVIRIEQLLDKARGEESK